MHADYDRKFLELNDSSLQSKSIAHAIETIEQSCRNVYMLNNNPSLVYSSDITRRLNVAADFPSKVAELLDKYILDQEYRPKTTNIYSNNIYDALANLMLEIIFQASNVKTPIDECWLIQYSSVWSDFFIKLERFKSGKVILHKLRRLIYNEVIELSRFPNYRAASILGLCLNVMGLNLIKHSHRLQDYPLHQSIISWVKVNYITLSHKSPKVALECLTESVTYDKDNNRLIKTYLKGMEGETDFQYLSLDNPSTL